jgi:acetyl-CoA carboxylase carboxyl transferase subunit beta
MAWFKKSNAPSGPGGNRKEIPQGLWIKCEGCSAALYANDLKSNLRVCPKCNYHFRLPARERIAQLADEGTFEETAANLVPADPLKFTDSKAYPDRVRESQAKTKSLEALVTGRAVMGGKPVSLAVLDFGFIGGSMGSVMGEKFLRAVELAGAEGRTLVSVTCTGGARMQEGILSLMQMAKTASAVARFSRDGGLYISILANPSTAGVMASFASIADLIVAEPGALVGFAGPRVIEQTIRQKLPKGFQTSEFVQDHGFVDRIVSRKQLKEGVVSLISLLKG